MTDTATSFRHGNSGYRNHKCRCEECVKGHRESRLKYRPRSDSLKIRLDGMALINKLTRDGRLEAVENSRLATWRRQGINLYAADRWCVKLGYHPIEIWGQAFYYGTSEEEMDG